MKRPLVLVFFLVQCCAAFAANPGFPAFNTNQFDVTGNRVALTGNFGLTNRLGETTIFGSITDVGFTFDNDSNGNYRWMLPAAGLSGDYVFNFNDTNVTLSSSLWTNDGTYLTPASTSPTKIKITSGADNAFVLVGPSTGESFQFEEVIGGIGYAGAMYGYDNGGLPVLAFGFFSSTNYTLLDPAGDFGTGARYLFNTIGSASSGDLVRVQNQGTNRFTVDYLGNVSSSGAVIPSGNTNQITTDQNRLRFDLVNIPTVGSTDEFFNKTTDYAATGNGNVLKQTKYLVLQGPNYGDGAGAIPQTNNYTVTGLMHYTFSGSAATNANYVRYEIAVPEDLDTAGTVKIARYKFSTSGTSSSQVNWHAAFGQSATSAARTPTMGTHILFNVTPSSAAANDIFEAAGVTLTGWAAALTVGNWWVIEIARDGSDSNNDTMTDAVLVLSYTAKSQ